VAEVSEGLGDWEKEASGRTVSPMIKAVAREERLYFWGFSSWAEVMVNSAAYVTVFGGGAPV